MDKLPSELIECILALLEVVDLGRLGTVCRWVAEATAKASLWRALALRSTFNRPFALIKPHLPEIDTVVDWRRFFREKGTAGRVFPFRPSTDPTVCPLARIWSLTRVATVQGLGRVVTNTRTSGWSVACLDWPVLDPDDSYADYYCEFKLLKDPVIQGGNFWRIVCGVVSETFDFSKTRLDGHVHGYIAGWGGAVCGKNPQGKSYWRQYGAGDSIGVLASLRNDAVYFYLNGQCLGLSIPNLRDNLSLRKAQRGYFGVAMAEVGASVAITLALSPPSPPVEATPKIADGESLPDPTSL